MDASTLFCWSTPSLLLMSPLAPQLLLNFMSFILSALVKDATILREVKKNWLVNKHIIFFRLNVFIMAGEKHLKFIRRIFFDSLSQVRYPRPDNLTYF
jgi:hypothetical protein